MLCTFFWRCSCFDMVSLLVALRLSAMFIKQVRYISNLVTWRCVSRVPTQYCMCCLLLIHLTIGNSAVLVGLFKQRQFANQRKWLFESTDVRGGGNAWRNPKNVCVSWQRRHLFRKIVQISLNQLNFGVIVSSHWLTNSQDSCYRKMHLDVHSED